MSQQHGKLTSTILVKVLHLLALLLELLPDVVQSRREGTVGEYIELRVVVSDLCSSQTITQSSIDKCLQLNCLLPLHTPVVNQVGDSILALDILLARDLTTTISRRSRSVTGHGVCNIVQGFSLFGRDRIGENKAAKPTD